LAERTRAGLIQRHKEGCWTGGPAPYGYQVIAAPDGKKKLAIQPEEAEVVRFLFTNYLSESIGMKELARRLRQKNIPTRLGRPWQFTTLRGILTNRMVVGEVRYLRRCFRLNRDTGRRLPHFNEESSQLTQRDESLRIIDDETFGRVQERFAANGKRRPRGPRELRPFTRHLFCAECGNVCHCRTSKNTKGEYHYYGCGKRQMQGREACPNSVFVREDKLMDRVTRAMTAMFEDMDAVLAEAAAMARETLDLNRNESERLKAQMAEQDKLLVGLSRILIDPDIEPLAKKSIARQMAEAESKREQLREALEAVAVRGIANSDDLLADVRSAFLEARQNFAGLLTPPQLNRFIEEVAGPMLVLPDGRVVQKNDEWSINDDARKESDDSLRAPGIAGGGFEPPTSGL
jgi:site-specific DNA recombinase